MKPALLRLRLKLNEALDFGKSPPGAFAIGLLGVILAVYATWFNDKKAALAYALAISTPVLSQFAEDENLSLLFNGRAIDNAKTPLEVVYVRLWNSGDTTFRPPDFDPKSPIGIAIAGGNTLRATISSASNEYLAGVLVATLTDQGRITISPAILEPKDSFVIKAMVQKQSPSSQLAIKPFGKIAGVSGFDEFYPRTAGEPGLIIEYRSVSKSRLIVFGVIALALCNFAYSIFRWWKKRRISLATQKPRQRDEA